MTEQKTAVVDLDNTISGYDHWRGPAVFGPIIPYAADALKELQTWGWRVVVFTTRGDHDSVRKWLDRNSLIWCGLNSTAHNPPGTSHKPIAEVYFDDRACHCVGEIPFNWHRAMDRVRRRYQPRLDTWVDDAQVWNSFWERYVRAPRRRREFARNLKSCLDARERLVKEGAPWLV